MTTVIDTEEKISQAYTRAADCWLGCIPHFGRTVNLLQDCRAFGDAPDLWDQLDPVTALIALGAARAGPQALTLTLAREGTRWMKIAGAPTPVFEGPQADTLRPGDLITLSIETALPTAIAPLVLVVAAV